MKASRQEPWPVQIARLRQQAANERAQLVVHVQAVTGRTAGVRATASSVLGLADRLLGGGADGSAWSTFARASLLPLAVKAGSALLRSRLGRLVLVAAAVGGGVWWWRQASRPLPPQEPG